MKDWPPQSPDLKPIEQICGELENKLDLSIVHSKESLWLELQKAWDDISVEVLRKYIDTMPERCAAVIDAKGGHYGWAIWKKQITIFSGNITILSQFFVVVFFANY